MSKDYGEAQVMAMSLWHCSNGLAICPGCPFLGGMCTAKLLATSLLQPGPPQEEAAWRGGAHG